MAGCAMQTFNNVDANVWNCIKAKLAKNNIIVDSDTGSADAHGIYASWNYAPATQILQIQVTKITNAFVGCKKVNEVIHDTVEECYASHGIEITEIIEIG